MKKLMTLAFVFLGSIVNVGSSFAAMPISEPGEILLLTVQSLKSELDTDDQCDGEFEKIRIECLKQLSKMIAETEALIEEGDSDALKNIVDELKLSGDDNENKRKLTYFLLQFLHRSGCAIAASLALPEYFFVLVNN